MGRVLTIQRTTVAAAERARYVASLRERRQEFASADCRFWVFEEAAKPGEFVEFTEATSAAVLSAVHGARKQLAAVSLFNEVELD
ncbi:MAG TPA: hypothetical protein VJR92_05550 [Gemmatimonadaceae bacterium]|nr:hypothetical protein [Gemmatimonadaceae bacterium]